MGNPIPPADYTWELGVDWNAIAVAGVSYLRQGFTLGLLPAPTSMVPHSVKAGDRITFQIFDVTSVLPGLSNIKSFALVAKPAVIVQTLEDSDDPFDSLQPVLSTAGNGNGMSAAFGGPFNFWKMEPVNVAPTTDIKRFLLTFLVQAAGPAGQNSRLFAVDPEMVVGPNMRG